MPTEKVTFKAPPIKRAIKIAHSQGLAVTGFDIDRNGTIHLHTRDDGIANGKVLTVPSDEVKGLTAA